MGRLLRRLFVALLIMSLPAFSQDEADIQRAITYAKVLQSQMSDPDGFALEAVFLKPNRNLESNICYQFRERNSMGGMNREEAVVTAGKHPRIQYDWGELSDRLCTKNLLVDITDKVKKALASQSTSPILDAPTGTVNVISNPDAGDVYVDDEFVGNSPAVLKLKSGRHVIRVKMSGYQDWERELVVSGGTVNLNAKLEAGSSGPAPESSSTTLAKSQTASIAVTTASKPETQRSPETKISSEWIGITTRDDTTRGLVITRVLSGSAASEAGLKAGDVIVELNGNTVKSGMEFDVAISHSMPGSQVRIAYIRGAWKFEANVTVGKIGSVE
jgi:PDZ domain/PEGA domain